MKTNVLLCLSTILLFPLSGCNKEEEKVATLKDRAGDTVVTTDKGKVVVKDNAGIWPAVEETVRAQINALNKEDVDGYMSYIHTANPNCAATKNQVIDLTEKYDLRNTLEKLEPVSLTEDEAKVRFVQLTEKISGPAFSNNRTTGIHTLRKDDGKWKIFASETTSITAVP